MQKTVKWLRANNFAVFGINGNWGTITTTDGVSLIHRDTLEQPLKGCEQILEITDDEVLVRTDGKVGVYNHQTREYQLPLAHRSFPQTEDEIVEAYSKGFVIYVEDGKSGLYKFGAPGPTLYGYDSIESVTYDENPDFVAFRVKSGNLVGESSGENGEWFVPLQFQDYEWFPESVIARVTLNGKFGVWDSGRQKLVIPTDFESVDLVNEFEGTFTITQGGRIGIYDTINDEVTWQ